MPAVEIEAWLKSLTGQPTSEQTMTPQLPIGSRTAVAKDTLPP